MDTSRETYDWDQIIVSRNSDSTVSSRPSSDTSSPRTYAESVHGEDSSISAEIQKNKKNTRKMQQLFGDHIPEYEICLADFSCALSKDLLIRHGRLYVGREYVAFHSPIANTKFVIHVSDIKKVSPKTTMLIPSAMQIETDDLNIHLMSFMFRDNAMQTLNTIINAYRNKITKVNKLKTAAPAVQEEVAVKRVFPSPSSPLAPIFLIGAMLCITMILVNVAMLVRSSALNQMILAELSSF
ncbi:Protein Aster-B [Boothiomyces macroporosus]|uniref:Protein Aster-B n=1 Tax=Boothiomyces macroporosus TaxID=261099 RepID=A0AAD5Y4R8_9FUNG|nr:Protein Aster-B [Boothiomyces macroporosus]